MPRPPISRARRAERPADLTGRHRLVGYVPDLLFAPELRYLAEIEPDLSAALRSSSIITQYRMIAAGAGIGVLPCFIGDGDPRWCRSCPNGASPARSGS
jgi:DNA-binding transcriptional LysR family regulator